METVRGARLRTGCSLIPDSQVVDSATHVCCWSFTPRSAAHDGDQGRAVLARRGMSAQRSNQRVFETRGDTRRHEETRLGKQIKDTLLPSPGDFCWRYPVVHPAGSTIPQDDPRLFCFLGICLGSACQSWQMRGAVMTDIKPTQELVWVFRNATVAWSQIPRHLHPERRSARTGCSWFCDSRSRSPAGVRH